MDIYIDILFFINLFVDYILLIVTARLANMHISRLRITFAATLGAIIATAYFFVEITMVTDISVKIFSAFLIIIIGFKFSSAKTLFRCVVAFILSNIIFLGIMNFAVFVLKSNRIKIVNSTVYYDITAIELLLLCLVAYLLVMLYEFLLKRKIICNTNITVKIYSFQQKAEIICMVDTGNKLYDAFSNSPIVICDKLVAKMLFPDINLNYFIKSEYHKIGIELGGKLRMIPYKGVGSSGLIPAIKCDEICFDFQGEHHIKKSCIVGFTDISNDEIQGIINPYLFI